MVLEDLCTGIGIRIVKAKAKRLSQKKRTSAMLRFVFNVLDPLLKGIALKAFQPPALCTFGPQGLWSLRKGMF